MKMTMTLHSGPVAVPAGALVRPAGGDVVAGDRDRRTTGPVGAVSHGSILIPTVVPTLSAPTAVNVSTPVPVRRRSAYG